MTVSLAIVHNVIGPDRVNLFFPSYLEIPKPGQWIYINSDTIGVPETLVKITDVSITEALNEVYDVDIQFSRISLKEDILFQKLLKEQVNLVDEESEATEQIDLSDAYTRTDAMDLSLLSGFFYGVYYYGEKYSGEA